MNILFLSAWFPYPPDNGSKIRIYNLLKGLASRHGVTLLTFERGEQISAHLPVLKEICKEVEVLPWREFNPRSFKATAGYFSFKPRAVVDTFLPEMQLLVNQHLQSRHYQAVIVSELSMLPYFDGWRNTPALLEDVELATIYDQYCQAVSPTTRLRRYLTWWKTSRYIAQSLRNYKICTVVSEREQNILQQIAPHFPAIEIIANCVDVGAYHSLTVQPEPGQIIFTGALTYSANYVAVSYFLEEIFPLVKQAVPGVNFLVTGKTDGVDLPMQTTDPQVRFTGYVQDIKSLVASSWVSVVPLRFGAGTRLKILEAFALRTPVISTSKGAEGLEALPGTHLLVADTPREFATQLVHLLNNPLLRQKLVENAFRLVQEKYNWENTLPCFLRLVENIEAR